MELPNLKHPIALLIRRKLFVVPQRVHESIPSQHDAQIMFIRSTYTGLCIHIHNIHIHLGRILKRHDAVR